MTSAKIREAASPGIALHDAVVNFVFPQVREYVDKRLREEKADLSGSHSSG